MDFEQLHKVLLLLGMRAVEWRPGRVDVYVRIGAPREQHLRHAPVPFYDTTEKRPARGVKNFIGAPCAHAFVGIESEIEQKRQGLGLLMPYRHLQQARAPRDGIALCEIRQRAFRMAGAEPISRAEGDGRKVAELGA